MPLPDAASSVRGLKIFGAARISKRHETSSGKRRKLRAEITAGKLPAKGCSVCSSGFTPLPAAE